MMFGTKLSTARKNHHLSASALAKRCDVSRSYITLIEAGQRLPGAKLLPKLAASLNVPAIEMLDWYLNDIRQKMAKHLEEPGN